MRLFAALFYTSLFGPIVLFALLWRTLLSRRKEKAAFAVATLVSLGYGYLMLALLFRSALLGVITATACLRLFKRMRRSPSVSLFSLCFESHRAGCY